MAGAGMKDVKRRIKSVENTMQITKAMQLVASSKLRKAKERVETARPYFGTLYETIQEMAAANSDTGNVYTRQRPVKKCLYVVIAGDRGLAGGYNSNLFKFASALMDPETAVVLPLGKRTADYFSRRSYPVQQSAYTTVEELGLEQCYELAEMITQLYCSGGVDEVYFVYTEFVSMLSQEPVAKKILPLRFPEEATGERRLTSAEFDPSMDEILATIVPQYVGGMVYGAVSESFASEQAARRSAMEAASDNAAEMISGLSLMYNRARQGAITQEITEISGGAEALNG